MPHIVENEKGLYLSACLAPYYKQLQEVSRCMYPALQAVDYQQKVTNVKDFSN